MSKAKKLEYHFAATFRERVVSPKFDSLKLYGKHYMGTFYPKNTEEVQLIVKYCNKNKIKIVQKHQDAEYRLSTDFIFISMIKMTGIEVLEEDRVVFVDAGVETSDLLGLIEYKKLTLPCLSKVKRHILLDVLNDFSLNQQTTYAYGSLSSFVLGVEGVLGNGELVKFGSQTYQGVFSEFLKQMMLNTYGQYGIITKLKLKLLPLIPVRGLLTIEAHNLDTGIKILQKTVRLALPIEDLYFFDSHSIKKLSEYKKLSLSKGETPYVFLLQIQGSSLEEVEKNMDKIQLSLADVLEGIISIHQLQLSEEIEKRLAWKNELELAAALGSYQQRTEKLLLAPSKFQYFVSDLEYIKRDFGVDFLFSGSIQDGTIEVIFMNIQDETGLVWSTFQHEIRAKVLDILYVHGGRPMTYEQQEQTSIESFFMGNGALALTQKIQSLCDPERILIPANKS